MRQYVKPIRPVVDLGPPYPGEVCYDAFAPFPMQHVGKLTYSADLDPADEAVIDPPRNHCVARLIGATGLSVVRYTPYYLNQSLNNVLGSPDLIAELHARHLAKLGECGLLPWISDIAAGTHPSAPEGGLYTIQDELPQDAEIGLTDYQDQVAMMISVSQYHQWARTSGEPGCLEDIARVDQASKVDGIRVLHDVEPLYTINIP